MPDAALVASGGIVDTSTLLDRVNEQSTADPKGDEVTVYSDTDERALVEIERGVEHDDPAFARRLRRADRIAASDVAVVVLLVATAVLLVTGLATFSWFTLVAGTLTFLAAHAVDAISSS